MDTGESALTTRSGVHARGWIVVLSLVALASAATAAGIGLFDDVGKGVATTVTARGTRVLMYGRGLYRYDSLFVGAGFRGQDLVTLFIGTPLLLFAIALYSQNKTKGALLLFGMLSYILYAYASMALGAAYNSLFLVYVAIFSSSLFALLALARQLDEETLRAWLSPNVPRKGPAILMLCSGVVTLIVWLGSLVPAMVEGRPPDHLYAYTTMVTYALDLGIITPSCFLSGALILRNRPLGYVIFFGLAGVIIMLVPVIVAMTVFQLRAGVVFTTGEIVGPIVGFAALGVCSLWAALAVLRHVSV